MNSATHSLLIPILVISTLLSFQLLLASPSGEVEAEIVKVSGKDNVDMITKLGMLFGLHNSNHAIKHIRAHQLSPAQAPTELEVESQSPLSNGRHTPLVHGKEQHSSARRKNLWMIIAISISILTTLAIFGVMTLIVLVYRRRRRNEGHCSSSNKVSFDPEPDMFYLDSLAPFLESDSDHKMSNENKVTTCLESEGMMTLQSVLNSENHLEKDADHHVESSSSDGSESFHSICCSHCSIESMSACIDPSFDFSMAQCHLSPLTSSKSNFFSTPIIKKPLQPTNFIPSNIRKTPLCPLVSESLDSKEHLPSTQCLNIEMEPTSRQSFSTESSNPIVEALSESRSQTIRGDQEASLMQKLQTLQGIKHQKIPNSSNCNASIPKPPPPPQFQKSGGVGKPCLPPPFQPQQSLAVDKDGNPLPKLKPLHWDKVRAAPDRSMVWDKIRSSSFVLDEKTIELLFGYNMNCSVRNEELKGKNSPPGKQVLEHKRLQNLTILLKALNATAEQVCNALILGSGLGTQQLEALAKMAPTKEEEEKIYKYEGDIDELGSTENFLKVILSIPLAFSRIEVMLYMETFDDEMIHLKKSFAILEEACKELRSSRLFLRLLEAVLKTGNRMNVGTIRGGARAFKLDALLKLADVKGTDGKTTLLHFVVHEMNKSEGQNTNEKKDEGELELIFSLSSELCNVRKTATMDLDVLASSVSNLSKGMSKLTELVEGLSGNEKDANFVMSMRSFKKQGDGIMKELKDSEDKVFRNVREITEYYHGDLSKDEVNPLRIFVIVSDFLGMLDRVCKELSSSKSPQHLNVIVSLTRGC